MLQAMCQLSETMSVPRVCDKTDFAANSMRLQLLKASYLKIKMASEKKRPSQIVTAENTCSRLFPKCFFFFRRSNLLPGRPSLSRSVPTARLHITEQERRLDRDLQGLSGDIMVCSRWAFVTDL